MTETLLLADCLEALKALPENSVDALVTDPPYGWRFMGKAWDGADIVKTIASKHAGKREGIALSAGFYDQSITGNQAFQEWTRQWAVEVFRVLKPGAHALIFCGPRTYHRMASGVEDAGFEVRDQMQWLFGSGFPKSMNISIAIDKQSGAMGARGKAFVAAGREERADIQDQNGKAMPNHEPITDAAKQWSGWGTALKPANEPILLARKPLSEKTVVANVLKWGTGALNIDASRIGTEERRVKASASNPEGYKENSGGDFKPWMGDYKQVQGRFPANLILDEEAGAMLDAQSGHLHPSANKTRKDGGIDNGMFGNGNKRPARVDGFVDTKGGGASRFFYCAKASASERNAGLEGEGKSTTDGRTKSIDNPFLRGETVRLNSHPTVKPKKLMRYLCKLITPPKGVIIDPFMGSGSTGLAANSEGFGFIGIEREQEYFEIAHARISGRRTP